jgi:peptidylprolyl isomerase
VAGTKRDRQRTQRQARQAREAALARARARRQRNLRVGLAAVVLVGIAVFVATRGGDSKPAAAPSTTTAGKPCVAVADPLPPGAPSVPVQVGPPPTQLVSQDLRVGTGATVGANDTVTVNYIGVACSTGRIFDSSYSRNQPATFPLSGVIKGWTDGIPNMKVGGQRLLGIPPDQAYGASGSPPDIGPGETLWFVVEVLDTKPS